MFYNEIYRGNDLILFNKILDTLKINNIVYRIKTENLKEPPLKNGKPDTGLSLPGFTIYIVLIKKQDVEKSLSLISCIDK